MMQDDSFLEIDCIDILIATAYGVTPPVLQQSDKLDRPHTCTSRYILICTSTLRFTLPVDSSTHTTALDPNALKSGAERSLQSSYH